MIGYRQPDLSTNNILEKLHEPDCLSAVQINCNTSARYTS